MRRQTGRQGDRETGRQGDSETGTGRQGDRRSGGYLQHRITVGIGDVDLQSSKVGVIIVAKVKRLNACREGCGHRAGVRGYIEAYLTWST